MPASIAKNAQEGTRSEYLAQYILSSFGTSIPVPHPEDSGIDLYCTLGKRLGRKFLVEDYYLVQVKSNHDAIKYSGSDEVKWLLSHKYPLFLCVVEKKSSKIEIFHTLALSTLSAKSNLEEIILTPKKSPTSEYFPDALNEKSVEIYLGEPALRFSIAAFSSENKFRDQLHATIKSWIKLDQENINLKSSGCTIYRVPKNWISNEPVKALDFKGNFKDIFQNIETKKNFDTILLKHFSQLILKSTADANIEHFNSLVKFSREFILKEVTTECFEVGILDFVINYGRQHLGLDSL